MPTTLRSPHQIRNPAHPESRPLVTTLLRVSKKRSSLGYFLASNSIRRGRESEPSFTQRGMIISGPVVSSLSGRFGFSSSSSEPPQPASILGRTLHSRLPQIRSHPRL